MWVQRGGRKWASPNCMWGSTLGRCQHRGPSLHSEQPVISTVTPINLAYCAGQARKYLFRVLGKWSLVSAPDYLHNPRTQGRTGKK